MINKVTSTNAVSVRARILALTASIIPSLFIFFTLLFFMQQLLGNSIVYAAVNDVQFQTTTPNVMSSSTSSLFAKESNLSSGNVFSNLDQDIQPNSPTVSPNGLQPFEMPQKTSIPFIENVGQFDDAVRFQANIGAGTWHFTDEGVWLTVQEETSCTLGASTPSSDLDNQECANDPLQSIVNGVNIKLDFIGSNPNPSIIGINPVDTTISYIRGSNPDTWYTAVPAFAGVRYEDVYPGIDIEYTSVNGDWQPQIIADASADLSVIDLQIEGADASAFSLGEQLHLDTALGSIELPLFTIQQEGKIEQMSNPKIVGQSMQQPFLINVQAAGDIDNSQTDLLYSTFVGDTTEGVAIDTDDNGNAYITGNTGSSTFTTTVGVFQETQGGGWDIFVTKLNADGSGLIYSTYFGGAGYERGNGIVVDDQGNVIVTGLTHSDATTFPLVNAIDNTLNGVPDIFIAKLNADGTNLIYSTYFGGTGGEHGLDVTVDNTGAAYIVGQTTSSDFPVTIGSSYAGDFDAVVVKLSTTGTLNYATYVGGGGLDCEQGGDILECNIAVNANGGVTIAGSTFSNNLPTTANAYDSSLSGTSDVFVAQLASNGAISYLTYLGGSGDECRFACGVAIDTSGAIYVTGSTNSADFPMTSGAIDNTANGGWDGFVTKLVPGNSFLSYSTYLGGGADDDSYAIVADDEGNVYVTGTTSSYDFPITPWGYQTINNSIIQLPLEVFIAKINTNGLGLVYASYFGGWSEDQSYDIAVDAAGNVYITGESGIPDITTPGAYQPSPINGHDAFVAKFVSGPSVTLGQDWNVECPFCTTANTQSIVNGINTRNGTFSYQETDFSLPIVGGELAFRRSYVSAARDTYTTTMGYGWVHNYDLQLHISDPALTHTIILQAPGGSRFPYYGNGDGTYTKYVGVTAELERIAGSPIEYIVTTYNQMRFTFNEQGQITQQEDPNGNTIIFTYADFNGEQRLFRATQGTRYLEYDYSNGYLSSVIDSSGRQVTLTYTNDDLTSVVGPLTNATITYQYKAVEPHLLTEVIDASGRTVKEIFYDSENRAYQLQDGEGNLLVDIDFGNLPTSNALLSLNGLLSVTGNAPSTISATTTITANGVVMSHAYDALNTLVNQTFTCVDNTPGCQAGTNTGYDNNFKQNDFLDANDNQSQYSWNAGGSNLEQITDALDNQTGMQYDTFNNLTQTVNARGITSTYAYDNASFSTFLTQMTDGLGNSTLYTPTTVADGVPGLLKQQEDPDGRITTYSYNDFAQITQTVRAAGTSEAITTTYSYDAVGRLTTTTQTSAAESRTSRNVYDNGNRLIAAIANWDGLLDWQNCPFAGGSREENICTLYDYDSAGRTISMTNTLGQTNLTFYDAAGRSFLNVANWDGSSYSASNPLPDLCNFSNPGPEFNLCSQTEYDAVGRSFRSTDSLGRQSVSEYDSLGRVDRSISNWQDGVFNANDPDADIQTLYEYDANGNSLIVTDTVGRMSRTFYDALNRVSGTISNWDGTTTLANCSSLPTMRDNNICSQYQYDEVGNTIIVTDTLGRMSRTFYDDLNRVEATVANWQPTFTSPANCVLSPTNEALENICTLYGYDDAGNQITTTNALNQTSLTVYDAANRPFLTVQNWDGTPISSEANCSFPPTQSDTNVCSVTYFDALGRRSSSKDPLGTITDFAYDGLGRLITTTRYLDGLPITTATEYDALGNRLTQTDAEQQDTTFAYDSLNRLALITSAEGVTRTQLYNAAGWVLQTFDGLNNATTMGYDDYGRCLTVTNAENNTTTTEYDALGNQTAMIDAETIRTSYQYDDLNRLLQVIENDVAGNNPTNESDVVTQYSYDALGNRIFITNALGITNTTTIYDVLNRPTIVEDALGNQTTSQYNALGYRTVMTDGNNAVTTYAYDGLNRLITVNYLADNEMVQYSYDALGNRTVMTDSLGTTSYSYDDLYRLTGVNDPFTATVGYDYDKVGSRTNLIYPDNKVVTYTYDLDNRLETVLDWDSGTTVYDYDLAGRLITTTLPNGVISVNSYDNANRLTNLSHTSSNDILIASFEYTLDKLGNRTVVTETIRQPGALAGVTAFLEENGQLVLEAESGTTTDGTTHSWNSQTTQSDYAGTAYLRALPDIGQQYDANATDSPSLNFTVQIDNPGTYTVWARGMAPDAGGDSLHVGVDGGAPSTAASLTGFAPSQWNWSRLTMSNTNAAIDLNSSGIYTLNVSMREDGLRLDKLMLVTDTATIPTGQGLLESPTTNALPNLDSHTIQYGYDPLYRPTDVTYSGDITATYQYDYNEVGNRTTYTATITATQVTTYTYNAANQLITAKEVSSPDIWYYVYDGNGNLVRQVPNGLTAADGEVRYTFNQRNLLVQIENHDGSSYLPQAEMNYDGAGNRLQGVSFVLGSAMTTTYTLDSLNNRLPLAVDNGTDTRTILYGRFGLGEFSTEWTYYLGDGQLSVRQLMDSSGNIALSRTYGPFGQILQEAGNGSAIYGFVGAQAGGGGLLYINGRYFDPTTGRFLSPDNNFDPLRPGTLNGYLSAAFLFAPFGVIIWRKRKKRGGRYDLMLFLMLGIGLGMMLVSCAGSEDGEPPTPILVFEPPAIGTDTPTPDPTSTPPSPTGTPTSTPTNVPTATPNNPATPTPSPTPCPPTPTPIPDTSGWTMRGKQAYYSLSYITNKEFSSQPWWGEYPEPKELAAWILQAEGSIILGDGKRYMAEGIRYRFDSSTCGSNCPSDIAWLSGFTPFLLFTEGDVFAIEAGAPLEQVVYRPGLDRLLSEPQDQYKQLMYPLFDNSPQYVLLGNPPAIYWWSREDSFTAPIEEYENPGTFSSCRYRARYGLATGSFIWFGTQTQFDYAIWGGGLPVECGS